MDVKLNKSHIGAKNTKFTPENIEAILAEIEKYVPHQIACASIGVSPDSLRVWMAQGRFDMFHNIESEHYHLVRRLELIKANKIKENVDRILASPNGHAGCQYILSRRFSYYFSDRTEIQELRQEIEELKAIRQGMLENGKEIKEVGSGDAHEKRCITYGNENSSG
jgi:hypothetical protein